MKKILCILLALLLVGALTACAKKKEAEDDLSKYLQEEETVDKVKMANGDVFSLYTVDTTTVIVTGYENGSHDFHAVTIPAQLAGKKVIGIGAKAFYNCDALTAVEIPETVASIGEFAFAGCIYLEELSLPASVKTIGKSAFYGCVRLTSLTFAANGALEEIPETCFWGCSALTSVTIPGSIKTVGKGAFYGCSSLETLVVEEGVETIREQAFQNLSKLTDVTIPESTVCEPLAFAGTPRNAK